MVKRTSILDPRHRLSDLDERLLPRGRTFEELISKKLTSQGTVKVLEIGTGRGLALMELSKEFNKKSLLLYGMNRDEKEGIHAKLDYITNAIVAGLIPPSAKVEAPNIDIADPWEMPYRNNSFDIIMVAGVLSANSKKSQIVEEIYRILKLEGTAYVQVDQIAYHKEAKEGATPRDYKRLRKRLEDEMTPHFILMHKGKYVSFGQYIEDQELEDFKLTSRKFNNASVVEPGRRFVLEMRKHGLNIDLGLKKDRKRTKRYNELRKTQGNPASKGKVEVYTY